MKGVKTIPVIALLLCLAGCTKFSADCELIVMPHLMSVQGSPEDGAAYMVRVYAWYIDEKEIKDWAPGSYADADAGIVRRSGTGEVRSHGLAGGQSEDDSYVHLVVTSSPVLLVAVDPVNRFYACRTFRYEIPLEVIRIPVSFQLWRGDKPYKDNEWTVISDAGEKSGQGSE